MKLSRPCLDEMIKVLKKVHLDTNAKTLQWIARFELGRTRESSIDRKLAAVFESLVKKDNIHKEVIEYTLQLYYEKNPNAGTEMPVGGKYNDIQQDYPDFLRQLKNDGYNIHDRRITSTLPKELETYSVQDKLDSLLTKYELDIAKTHLKQALSIHKDQYWEGANAQIRSFFESILIEITKKINPESKVLGGGSAITELAQNGFLKSDLNEIDKEGTPQGAIKGVWNMLHPNGSHPGLSEEADCTFRLHLIIVTATYYLKRLEKKLEEK